MIQEITIPSPQPHFTLMKKGPMKPDLTIINDGRNYQCHAIVLSAISQKIYELMESEPTRKSIQFEFIDQNDDFQKIIDFCYGFDYVIHPKNYDITYIVSTELKIKELQEPSKDCLIKSFSDKTVIGSLLNVLAANGYYEPHLNYIRSHFQEMMDMEELIDLPRPILEAILSASELNIENENQLAYWVTKVVALKGREYQTLIDFLYLANLDNDALLKLCTIENINSAKLIQDQSKQKQEKNPKTRVYSSPQVNIEALIRSNDSLPIEFDKSHPFDGIIRYVLTTSETGKPNIKLFSSSVWTTCNNRENYFKLTNLLQLDNEHSCWYSHGSPDQWVLYDFSPRALKITGYTLRTSGGNKGSGHLKSWKIDVSNDNKNWVCIDERHDVDQLNDNYATFSIVSGIHCDQFYRFVRITQIGKNHHNDYSFILSCCEFYGEIVPKDIP